jgi:CelD/BcsL family acetyltransferase involved in cellulose biosynthesis
MNTMASASTTQGATIDLIVGYPDFFTLRDAWNLLAAERSVFLRHEWFDAAWQWRKSEDSTRLLVLCVHGKAGLIGILPLLHRSERVVGMPRRVLEFLTVPDNQFCDMLAAEGMETAVAEALAMELAKRRGEWDMLRLAYLPEQSLSRHALLPALERHGIAATVTESSGNSYISLEAGWQDYYAGRSRSLKKACNLAANRLTKAGRLGVEWLAPGALPTTAPSFLDSAVRISAHSWKRSTGNSLDRTGPQAFFRRLSELALKEGWLSLWLLTVDDKPIATEYQLIFAGQVHALRADFIEEYDELSPGTHLNRHLLEQLFGRGLQRYLMGPGDNPYKKRWTDLAEPLFRLDAYSPAVRGRLAELWDLRLKPALRRLKALTEQRTKADPQ